MTRAVVFDIGETIVDETRHWGEWADWLGVPRLVFFAALGALIERGEQHRGVFELLVPGIDLDAEIARRAAAQSAPRLDASDLYPDAAPCLSELHRAGYRVGLVANQPAWIEDALARLGLEVDVIASSERLGVEKPSPAFFARVAELVELPPERIAYVGDRLDNDVLPARAAGMLAVFVRRGPWGILHARRPEAARADVRLDSLADLLAELRAVDFAP